MTDSSKSIRFELCVNGETLATGGVGAFGVLTAIVSWARRNPDAMPEHVRDDPEVDREDWLSEHLVVDLGGLDSVRDESVNWVRNRSLIVGDEVVIRVLPPGPIDDAARVPNASSPG